MTFGEFLRRRAGADRAILLAVFAVLLTATTFAAFSVLYAETVASSGLSRLLARAGPAATDLAIAMPTPLNELDDRAGTVDAELAAALAGTDPAVLRTARTSGSFALPGVGATPDLTVFSAVDRLPDVAPLLRGAFPSPGRSPLEVVVTQAAAGALGVDVGTTLSVTSRVEPDRTVAVAIVGVVHAPELASMPSTRDRLLADGSVQGTSFRTIGPFILDPADLPATGETRVTIEWLARPDLSRVEPGSVGGLRARLAALPARLADQLGSDRAIELDTGLPPVLAAAAGSLLVGGTGILLLDLQLALIGTYALILVAVLMREWRQAETAILRTRGAGAEHLVRIATLESLWMVVAAVVLGPILAWLALTAAGLAGWLGDGARIPPLIDGPATPIVVAAGVLGLAGLTLPTLIGSGPLSAVRRSVGRQVQMTAAHRSGLDLALVVLAAVALWQLRAYGGPLTTSVRGSLGVDPLLVAAPAIGLGAGAILAMRGIPWLARRVASVLEGRAGMTGWLGARQLARRPLRYTAPALLLVVATAIGGFSVAYQATWRASQVDQVGHALGAPGRLTVDERSAPPAYVQAAAIGRLPGIGTAAPVVRSELDLGSGQRRGELLAIDAERVATLLALRPDLSPVPASELAAALIAGRPPLELPIVPLEAGVVAISVTADLRATRSDGSAIPLPPDWSGARAVVVVRDADGRLARFEGAETPFTNGRARLTVPLSDSGTAADIVPPGPLELVSVEVDLQTPPSLVVVGMLRIDAVAAAEGTLPATGTPIPAPLEADWAPVRIEAGADPVALLRDAVAPGRFTIPVADPLDDPAGARFALRPAVLSPTAGTAVPTLADPRLLDATGVAVGETVVLGQRFRDPTPLQLVGRLELVPGTDASRPAAIADLATFQLVSLATRDAVLTPSEWWLDGADLAAGAISTAAEADAALPGSTVTIGAADVRERLEDPVVMGVAGGLLTSAIAAAVFALIGLAVSIGVGVRERRAEFAVLRALGVTQRQVGASLALEVGFIVVCGIVAGLFVGAILAWVVLPSIGLTTDGSVAVPPARIDWPAWTVALTVAAGLVLWRVLTALARRQVHPERAAATLREGAE